MQQTTTDEHKAVQLLATGASQADVARELGVNRSTVCRWTQKEEVRARIEAEAQRLLEALPDVVEQTKRDLATANHLSRFIAGEEGATNQTRLTNPDHQLRFLEGAYRKQADLLRAAGVFASPAPSIVVQQVFNDNRTQVLSPTVVQVLGQHLSAVFADEQEEALEA